MGIACEAGNSPPETRTSLSLWNVNARQRVNQLPGTGAVRDVVFVPQSHLLAVRFKSSSPLILWDYTTGNKQEMQTSNRDVESLFALQSDSTVLSPDGKWRASSRGPHVEIDAAQVGSNSQMPASQSGQAGGVTALFFSGDVLAVGLRNGKISLWNKELRSPISTIQQPIFDTSRGVQAFAVQQKERALMAVAADGGVVRLDFSAPRSLQMIRSSAQGSRPEDTSEGREEKGLVRPAPPRAVMAAVVDGNGVEVSATPPTEEALVSTMSSTGITATGGLYFDPKIQTGYVSLSNADGKQTIPRISDDQRYGQDVTALSFSSNGDILAIGFSDNGVDLWSVAEHRLVKRLDNPVNDRTNGSVTSLAFDPDGEWLASGSTDRSVRVWNLHSSDAFRILPGHTASVLSLAFSSSDKGKMLASGGADDQIILWNPASGQRLRSMEGQSTAINTLTFVPSSSILVSGGEDGTVKLWDTANSRLLATLLPVHNGGDWLATTPEGFFDGTEGTWNEVLWQFNRDLFDVSPVEIGFRDYFYPNLLARILHGDSPTTARSIASLNRAQPVVRVLSATPDSPKTVCVTVEVQSGTSSMQRDAAGQLLQSGAYDLRLFRNGRLVAQSSRSGESALPQSAPDFANWRSSHPVHLGADGKAIISFPGIQLAYWAPSGANRFTAYAFNLDRVKSATSQPLVYHVDTDQKPDRHAWLITMGVNKNQYSLWNLTIPVPSATQVRSMLHEQLSRAYKVSDFYLYSEHGPGLARKNMLQAVLNLLAGKQAISDVRDQVDRDKVIRRATPDDLVVLYIASHGYADPMGNLYLVPYDTGSVPVTSSDLTRCSTNRTDPACSDADNFLRHTISSAELSEWWEGIDAEQAILIIDSCHSGAITGSSFRPAPLGDPGFGQLSYDKRMLLLAAAQAEQKALGDLNDNTTFLVKALQTIAAKNPGWSVTNWLREISQELPALEQQSDVGVDEVQSPVLLDFSDTEELSNASPGR
jgi:WD40 repeat protein